MPTVLELNDFSYTYPGAHEHALRAVSLSMRNGECLCVTGPSGSGKTTLLLAIKALLKGGQMQGSITRSRTRSFHETGLVFQNAESQILCATVEDEAAFGPTNIGLSFQNMETRVHGALEAVGLAGFEKRNVEHLSAGQKHRLTIASVLTMEPRLLLLDEPTGQLDATGKQQLLDILVELKKQGYSLLIVDHNTDPFRSLGDRFVLMEHGEIQQILDTLPPPLDMTLLRETTGEKTQTEAPQLPAISIHDLHLSGVDAQPVLRAINLKIYRKELVHVLGQNGAGKSTLLKCMTGLIHPTSGKIQIAGIDDSRPDRLLGKVGLLLQTPQRQLFEDTVYAEVAFSLKKMGFPDAVIREKVTAALDLFGMTHKMDQPPLALSFGEQHRVALASVIALGPEILLLDEPFAGLELSRRHQLLRVLFDLRNDRGTTIVLASHDPLPDPSWADCTVVLKNCTIERT